MCSVFIDERGRDPQVKITRVVSSKGDDFGSWPSKPIMTDLDDIKRRGRRCCSDGLFHLMIFCLS
ncbi:unnamed protein product [Brassica oleracea]